MLVFTLDFSLPFLVDIISESAHIMNLLIILYISWSDEHCIKILVEVLILIDLGSSSDHWQVLLNIVESISHERDYKV